MANPEHLKILKQGAKAWNNWRYRNSGITIDLSGITLPNLDLCSEGGSANLSNVDLSTSSLILAQLNHADLSGSNLAGANLGEANFNSANLNGVILHNTHLGNTNFTNASLAGADLSYARLGRTIFGNTNLASAVGLNTCRHYDASVVDPLTLAKSGKLPLTFLRGCGFSDIFIEYIPSLFNTPLEFYSCFISYSSKDQNFADRLYSDLQNNSVRCWYAPEDLKIGDRIRDSIDETIRLRDKLLVILSESSVASDWVEHEVESALEEETRSKRAILFPIRIDDAVFGCGKAWAAHIRRTRHIGNFTGWLGYSRYLESLNKLLRDLKAQDKRQ